MVYESVALIASKSTFIGPLAPAYAGTDDKREISYRERSWCPRLACRLAECSRVFVDPRQGSPYISRELLLERCEDQQTTDR